MDFSYFTSRKYRAGPLFVTNTLHSPLSVPMLVLVIQGPAKLVVCSNVQPLNRVGQFRFSVLLVTFNRLLEAFNNVSSN